MLRVVRETSTCVGGVSGVGVSALELLRSEVEAAHVVTFSSQVWRGRSYLSVYCMLCGVWV